jgi:hypothetical protein
VGVEIYEAAEGVEVADGLRSVVDAESSEGADSVEIVEQRIEGFESTEALGEAGG